MTDIRIKDLSSVAAPATDDAFVVDGPTNGTRKVAIAARDVLLPPGYFIAKITFSPSANERVVRISDYDSTTDLVPKVSLALGTQSYILTDALALYISKLGGGGASSGDLVLCARATMLSTQVIGGGSAGDAVYVNNAGKLASVAGTLSRRVGKILSVLGGGDPGSYMVEFDGGTLAPSANTAAVRVVTGATDTLQDTDVVVEYSYAGPVAVTIGSGLSPGAAARTILLQGTNALTQITVTPPGGGSIDGLATLAASAGVGAIPLRSKAGSSTVWYSGYPAPTLPTNTVAPVISGSVGHTGTDLSCTTGTWTGGPLVYSYQWKRNGVSIGGATGSTYTQGSSDIGPAITCVVTGTNAFGVAATGTSNSLAYVPDADVIDWLDPSTLTPGAVTTWLGQKGVWSPTQATSGHRPVASATSLGGTPGVTADGGDDFLSANLNLSAYTAIRVVFAAQDASAALRGIWSNGDLSGAGQVSGFANDSVGQLSVYTAGAGAGLGFKRTTSNTYDLATPTVVSACADSAVTSGCGFIRVDGTAVGLNTGLTGSSSVALANRGFAIFSDTASAYWPGTLGVFAIMGGNAQDDALDRVERFCAYRAGLGVW